MLPLETKKKTSMHTNTFTESSLYYWTSPANVPAAASRLRNIYFSLLLLSLKMKNLRAGCVLLVATLSLCGSQRAPIITYIADDQWVDQGNTVEIGCSVQYAGPEYPVIWSKIGKNQDNIFISTGTSLVLKESRFALLYDGASATYIVLIKDVQESDSGTYQCTIVLSVNNKISSTTNLYVRSPPSITDNSTTSIVAQEGEPVHMECYASGNPQPTVVWRRENNAILPTG